MRLIILKLNNYILSFFILIIFIQSCGKPKPYYQTKLDEFENILNNEKEKYWNILEKYSLEYLESQRDSISLNRIVQSCKDSDTMIKVSTFVNHNGIIIETLPRRYEIFKGIDVSKQAHVQYIEKYKVRFISRKFNAVQGFEAISFINPIVENKKFLGTLNILIDPHKFIKSILKNFTIPDHSRLLIIQGDGVVLYSDLVQFNKTNIITYPDFDDNLAESLIKTIGSRRQGEFSIFYNIENKKVKIFWKQIPMEKDKWAFVIINNI